MPESPIDTDAHTAPSDPADRVPVVALLEDDRVLCLSLELHFEQLGIPLMIGHSATGLIAALDEEGIVPDVLVVDYFLDDVDTAITNVPLVFAAIGRELPVIVTTGDDTPGTREELRQRGWRLLRKPYEPDALRAAIKAVLARP